MDIKIELVWKREDIERLLEKDAQERGFLPLARDAGETVVLPPFEWTDHESIGKTALPLIEVKATAELAPKDAIPPGTLVVHPPVAMALPPNPQPQPQPRKILSDEEIDELSKLLPHPEYANQILNSKAIIREMLPGESQERPD